MIEYGGIAMSGRFKIEMEEPVVASWAPQDVKGSWFEADWGGWAGPQLEHMADGGLHINFSLGADDARDFGMINGHCVSYDGGASWEERDASQSLTGNYGGSILLANGDRLKPILIASIKTEWLRLLEPVFSGKYGPWENNFYHAQDIPSEYGGWFLLRQRKNEKIWKIETADVHYPGAVREVREEVLIRPFFSRLRPAPDGAVWGIITAPRIDGGDFDPGMHTIFVRSVDYGHTWEYLGEIPFHEEKMPFRIVRENIHGLYESDVLFLQNGNVLCIMRTTQGIICTPMFTSVSRDGGMTWSEPEYFDSYGILPTFADMGDCALLLYGRPGICVRISDDPERKEWSEKTHVPEFGEVDSDNLAPFLSKTASGFGSCCNSDILKLDSRTALLAYSNYIFPDKNGVLRKTILTRKIHIKEV